MADTTHPPVKQNGDVPQLGLGVILLMFVWPAAWYTFLIYVVAARLVPPAGPHRLG